jgi:predicted transcriptional regulator
MNNGWISIHRKILDNPIVCKDSDYFTIWIYLLLNATHKPHDVIFNGKRITLQSGQLITGRKAISEKFNISESKVQRVLKMLESEQQIEQQTTNINRLISVVKWEDYQKREQQSEQQVNNERTTSEQQVNTNNNDNTVNNGNNVNKGGYSFSDFWFDYDKKKGDKDKIEKKFNKLSNEVKLTIKNYLPLYKQSTPDKNFRKNPDTFLNNKGWEDEIIMPTEKFKREDEPTRPMQHFV